MSGGQAAALGSGQAAHSPLRTSPARACSTSARPGNEFAHRRGGSRPGPGDPDRPDRALPAQDAPGDSVLDVGQARQRRCAPARGARPATWWRLGRQPGSGEGGAVVRQPGSGPGWRERSRRSPDRAGTPARAGRWPWTATVGRASGDQVAALIGGPAVLPPWGRSAGQRLGSGRAHWRGVVGGVWTRRGGHRRPDPVRCHRWARSSDAVALDVNSRGRWRSATDTGQGGAVKPKTSPAGVFAVGQAGTLSLPGCPTTSPGGTDSTPRRGSWRVLPRCHVVQIERQAAALVGGQAACSPPWARSMRDNGGERAHRRGGAGGSRVPGPERPRRSRWRLAGSRLGESWTPSESGSSATGRRP